MILLGVAAHAQQIADPHFDARVENPAYTKNFPRVLFDEATTISTPSTVVTSPSPICFSTMVIMSSSNRQPFTKESLNNFKILVIVNPLGAEDMDDENAGGPAFTSEECDAVNDWVRGGGALLFIVDAEPFASAAEILARSWELR